MKFIDTERQLADIFTKPLDSSRFASLQGGAWCLPSLWFGLRGSLWFALYICISLLFCCIFLYSAKSPCFTCYTSLYLLNYAYHCARMSSNEMWAFFARPCLITCYDCNVEYRLKLDNSINFSYSPLDKCFYLFWDLPCDLFGKFWMEHPHFKRWNHLPNI
jgi:hypothetical protein